MVSKVFLKEVQVIDPTSPLHQKTCSLVFSSGQLRSAEDGETPADDMVVWDGRSGARCVSLGWWDGQVDFGCPGSEEREGIASGLKAAAAGGFTDVTHVPTTSPVMDSQADIIFLKQQAHTTAIPTRIHPLGSLSRGLEGQSLSDMQELRSAGAVGFSEGGSVDSPELLRRALEYLRPNGTAVLAQPMERKLHRDALMNEGITSTVMGLQGTPPEAESMRLRRDLDILRYTGGHLHLPIITTQMACDEVSRAKSEGLNVTCGTTAFHLLHTDADLAGFDGGLKVMPPFRSESDRVALCKAVWDGTIDCIVSDHCPWNLERHDVEFMLVPFGIAGIEWTYPLLNRALQLAKPEASIQEVTTRVIELLAMSPRRIFQGLIANEGGLMTSESISLTFFDPMADWSPLGESRAANVPKNAESERGLQLGIITDKGALTLRPEAH
ncbi:MAG: dihydroorotase [Flavobacteriales bacterium]